MSPPTRRGNGSRSFRQQAPRHGSAPFTGDIPAVGIGAGTLRGELGAGAPRAKFSKGLAGRHRLFRLPPYERSAQRPPAGEALLLHQGCGNRGARPAVSNARGSRRPVVRPAGRPPHAAVHDPGRGWMNSTVMGLSLIATTVRATSPDIDVGDLAERYRASATARRAVAFCAAVENLAHRAIPDATDRVVCCGRQLPRQVSIAGPPRSSQPGHLVLAFSERLVSLGRCQRSVATARVDVSRGCVVAV